MLDEASDSMPPIIRDRIAILSHAHPSVSKGGAEIAAYTLYSGLRELGIDALFIAACQEADRPRLHLGSEREHAVFYDPRAYDHFYHLSAPEVARQVARILAEERVSVANFHHFLFFGVNSLREVARGGSVRTILTLHEFLAICHHHGQMVTNPARLLCERSSPRACANCFTAKTWRQFDMRRILLQQVFAAVHGFISPSRFLVERFSDWGLSEDRMEVIENGLRHTPADPRRQAARQAGAPWVFGFFGQINPFKGVDTLLRAAEELARLQRAGPPLQIRIHGNVIGVNPEFAERFRTLAETLPGLSYAGPYDNNSVSRLMAACDYVLVPSTWWENSPLVIQEAYAARRPVICSNIGGMAEKVKPGISGLHFRVGDPLDLARTLGLAADEALYAKLTSGLPRVSNARRMARQYLAAFRRFATSLPDPASLASSGRTAAVSRRKRDDGAESPASVTVDYEDQ